MVIYSAYRNLGKPHSIVHHTLAGYEHVYDIRPDKPGGGCSLFINENIPYTLRKDLMLAKSVFIEVEKCTLKNIILGVIYRSPESSLTDFNDNLENILVKIDKNTNICFYQETIMSTLYMSYLFFNGKNLLHKNS